MHLESKVSKKAGLIYPENALDSKSNRNIPNQHANFLYVYFWYAYILLLSPFRFQKVGGGVYEVYRWRPQQWLCGLSTVLCLLRLLTSLRSAIPTNQGQNPNTFFLLFCEGSSLIYKTAVFRVLWTNSCAVKRLINFLNKPHLLPCNPFQMESVISISLFCGAYAIVSFIRLILGSTLLNYWDWSPASLYRRLVTEARFTFFLCNSTSSSNVPTMADITVGDHFLSIVQALSMQARFTTGYFVDLCIVMHTLTLWAPTSAFAAAIYRQLPGVISGHKSVGSSNFETSIISSATLLESNVVLKQFEALKMLTILISEAVGSIILPFLSEALFYYAIYVDSVVMTPDVVARLVLIFFYMSGGCILLFSAEIVRKMRWFKTWLGDKDRVTCIRQNQLTFILDDSVGITASGILTINYTFVGAMISVLITYFIIRLQSVEIA